MASRATTREGWTQVRFGDVVENINDQPKRSTLPLDTRYIAGEHVDENRLTIDRWGSLGDDLVPPTFKRRFQSGDVLFHSRNLKKIAVPDFGGITGEKLFVLRSTSPDLLQEFVPYVLLAPAFAAYAEASWSGSVNKFLNWTPLAQYEFHLPPLIQQRHTIQVSAKVLEVGESWRVAYQESLNAHSSLVRHLLEDCLRFPVVPLRSVCVRVGVGIASSAAHAYRDVGVPMIRNTNIKQGFLDTADLVYLDPDYDEANKSKRVRAGDVVTCRTGTPGASAVVPEAFHDAQTFTTLITTPRVEKLEPRYLSWWLNGPPGQSFIASRKAGAVQQNLNATLLAQMPIALPSLDQQQHVVSLLERSLALCGQTRARAETACRLPMPL